MKEDISVYLSGKKLYGDDFSINEIEKWFVDEAEGYSGLGAKAKDSYKYVYHELNRQLGFKFLGTKQFNQVLGIGSAYGEEFQPLSAQIEKIIILDPSDAFSNVQEIAGTPCEYIKPSSSGNMPFESHSFDLVTSLGVMHHIPNVSYVISECYRCLNDGGYMLLHEPVTSMGDWRKPRRGLTNRERGIPLDLLDNIVQKQGLKIKHRSLCKFPIVPMIGHKLHIAAYNNYLLTQADGLLSKLFAWNVKYHRVKIHEKLAPSSVFYVLEK